MSGKPITAIIVGAGHRAITYASYARQKPDELQIVGVAEPNDLRRKQVADLYGIPEDKCFRTAQELAEHPKFADAVINGTMDQDHVPTSIPLLKAGYDMLLEKPFAVNEKEMWELVDVAREYNRTVMICHVLRYAPFYAYIRKLVADGVIGEILNIQTTEHVSYHHMAVAFIRGKWNNEDVCGSPMLMAKCCHDLDLLAWMKSGIKPVKVSSFGGRMYFREEKAPQGAGTRCLVDCPPEVEQKCLYSARKHYLDHPVRWRFYVWHELEHVENPTMEQKEELLKTSDYGRCVWKSDNNVVDHQSVVIEFADGSTATHNLVGGASRPSRSIHLLGTHGEIQGNLEESKFVVRHIDPSPGHEYTEEVVDLKITGDMHGAFGGHGGGDLRLVADFCRTLRGEEPSISCTTIEDSVSGHLIGFRADRAMKQERVEHLDERSK
jgi:predicted dehydrogenase